MFNFTIAVGDADVFERDPKIEWRPIEGRVVLIDDREAQITRFNEIGSRIWQELDGKRRLGDIASRLELEYDVSPDALWEDARRFMKRLLEKEFVRKVDRVSI